MLEQVENIKRAEQPTRSEIVREALRTYIAFRQIPQETPTRTEFRAIRRGRAANERGDYVILDR